jgi:flagellar biosynthetic protein FlhB
MAEDSDLEKTEAATGRRIQRAREEGQVVRSHELSTFVELMTALGALIVMGDYLMDALSRAMRQGFSLDRASVFDPSLMMIRFQAQTTDIVMAFLPLLGFILIAAVATPFLLSGWNFSFKPLQPSFTKLNPATGIGRVFSVNGLVELLKAIAKSLLIGGIAAWVIWRSMDVFFALPGEPLNSSIAHVGDLVTTTSLFIVGAMALLVIADVPFQIWHYGKNLRMTKEEVRQEAKESEGDPQIKARIRSMQREAARKRMMAEIPKAQVVVTNPTHFAVALRYEEGMAAPRVVAKGSALLAERIIELARESRVTVLQAPPLARALYRHTEIGDEVPQRLYTAVAQVLAYVYQLRQPVAGAARPQPPSNLPVPADMDPEAAEAVAS